MKAKPEVSVYYSIRIKGQYSSFAQSGYSKFYKRLAIRDGLHGKARKIRPYGLKQALEHISELRKFRYKGKMIHALASFEVVKTTTIEEIVA
jgi:hypothetical protein